MVLLVTQGNSEMLAAEEGLGIKSTTAESSSEEQLPGTRKMKLKQNKMKQNKHEVKLEAAKKRARNSSALLSKSS
jgi:hypothetical protein